ncbi:MAG: hypothetical protein MUF54_07155 [Polyangiaceae bacterium]|nr:hypothetical protein [Polyangiaceae bacterium]
MTDDGQERNDPTAGVTDGERAQGEPPRSLAELAAGQELPPFSRSFPADQELLELVRAFERGQHDVVRREAPALANRTADRRVADAAVELRRRLDVDPLATKLLVGAVALLLLLTVWVYAHQHP